MNNDNDNDPDYFIFYVKLRKIVCRTGDITK